jgi:hypothetical protein
MEEWMKIPVSQLKRLVKSRAGRIAELQMEVKVLEGIIEKKVRDGDLGGQSPRKSTEKKPEPRPEKETETGPGEKEEDKTPEQETKINNKSSDHAFKEID